MECPVPRGESACKHHIRNAADEEHGPEESQQIRNWKTHLGAAIIFFIEIHLIWYLLARVGHSH